MQVMRSCREMGIKMVAVYSDADTQAVRLDMHICASNKYFLHLLIPFAKF